MSNATDDARIAQLATEMSARMLKLADALLDGNGAADARRIAGYASDASAAAAKKNVKFCEYMALCRKKVASNAIMTREDACRILAEGARGEGRFKGARLSEAKGAISELAKINGWYEPEKQEISGSLVDRIRKGNK